jgi:uncharacterized protein (TIGR02466 family)
MLIQVTPELSLVFGTPMAARTVPNFQALNSGLERTILSRAQSTMSNKVSNVGGWQSKTDFLDWPEPEIAQFRTEIDRGVQMISAMPTLLEGRPPDPRKRVEYEAYGWANVNQSGHYNTLHVHAEADWSVVYYVSPGVPVPDTMMNGRIEFRDPRPGAAFVRTPGFINGQPMLLKPQAGLMIVFPSWLEHWVHPFFGEGNRVSIAVNVMIKKG